MLLKQASCYCRFSRVVCARWVAASANVLLPGPATGPCCLQASSHYYYILPPLGILWLLWQPASKSAAVRSSIWHTNGYHVELVCKPTYSACCRVVVEREI